jgi:hypothetical protein
MKEIYKRIDFKKAMKIALVAIPVIVWDMTYYIVTKIYEGFTFIDKKGETFLNNFMSQ